MDQKRDFIERLLPYRLEAIEIFRLAANYRLSWDSPRKMEIRFDDKLSIEGLSTGFTNSVLEVGVIHCRALLEFMGLRLDPKDSSKLIPRRSNQPDDLLIEHFCNTQGPLSLVTPEQAVAPYAGPKEEAAGALARVIYIASKGLNHVTSGPIGEGDDLYACRIASDGVIALMTHHFFVPLGIQPPAEKVTARRRDEKQGSPQA
jgi:hypothetical protein